MEILIILGLILLNGLFSMAELALVSARRYRLEQSAKKGSGGARTAIRLSDDPTRFLSTVQIGITLIGILLGVYSGEALTVDLVEWLSGWTALRPFAHQLAVGMIVIAITYLSIVLGELFPKRLGMTFPEAIAIATSPFMNAMSRITTPFVWLLSVSNNALLRVFGIHRIQKSQVTEEEIKSLVRESAAGGEIRDVEQNMVERVFELGDRKINSLLTHRSDLVFFDLKDDRQTVFAKINAEKHSAYPVCEDHQIDRITGVVLIKDLFDPDLWVTKELKDILRQPLYVNETASAYRVLEEFKLTRNHYAIVVDEYGTTQGIVTMDDFLDALVGSATEIYQEEYQILARDENSWLVDGQYPVLEFLKYFDMDFVLDPAMSFTTVAGWVIHLRNGLPKVGEFVTVGEYRIEVVDKDGPRIDKILVTRKVNDR